MWNAQAHYNEVYAPGLEDAWYIHADENEGGFVICRTFEDMWVTLKERFDTIPEAQAYASKVARGEIRLSNPNF